MFRPAFGCAKHPKAGRNTQQLGNAYPYNSDMVDLQVAPLTFYLFGAKSNSVQGAE